MRKTILSILLVSSFLFLGCYSGDDDSGPIDVTINDAIVVENEGDFKVGDVIFFEIRFSRFLEEEGFDNLLDIYETTGLDLFSYSYGFSKFSTFINGFERVNIDSDFIIIEEGGDPNDFSSFSGSAMLNDEKTEYVSRVGIILQEPGDFRFDFGFTNFSSFTSVENGISVFINHEFTSPQPEDFQFTVTE